VNGEWLIGKKKEKGRENPPSTGVGKTAKNPPTTGVGKK